MDTPFFQSIELRALKLIRDKSADFCYDLFMSHTSPTLPTESGPTIQLSIPGHLADAVRDAL